MHVLVVFYFCFYLCIAYVRNTHASGCDLTFSFFCFPCFCASQGLDSHRHSAAHFEDTARRKGLQLICIDRPGRGRSDPIPSPVADASEGGEVDVQALMSEAVENSVVDTVKQVRR